MYMVIEDYILFFCKKLEDWRSMDEIVCFYRLREESICYETRCVNFEFYCIRSVVGNNDFKYYVKLKIGFLYNEN